MVQFGVLANAAKMSPIDTDNIRLLKSLQIQNVISEQDAEILTNAYCTYRDAGHKRGLQGDKTIINAQEFVELRGQVTRIWQTIMR